MTPTLLASMAIQVHHVDAMVTFYSEAFGATFERVDMQGMQCWFGTAGDVLLKLVPMRSAPDFENFPVHQPGFQVPDVDAVIAIATRHGGRQEGDVLRSDGAVHGAVRDPDGNTIELYARSDEEA